jgi:uncharacterized membrane protein
MHKLNMYEYTYQTYVFKDHRLNRKRTFSVSLRDFEKLTSSILDIFPKQWYNFLFLYGIIFFLFIFSLIILE